MEVRRERNGGGKGETEGGREGVGEMEEKKGGGREGGK